MKRNTSDELLYPVNLKGGWYYVNKHRVDIYVKIGVIAGNASISIPRKRLERLLKIKGVPK